MTYKIFFILCFTYLGSPSSLHSQEICNNGFDDDGNGFTDYMQEICSCGAYTEVVVKTDFEMRSCCPSGLTPPNSTTQGIYCLSDGWTSISPKTTPDYFNACGYLGGSYSPAPPLPFPSGDGVIGLTASYEFIESVGKCLDYTLLAGETYLLEFYVGFRDRPSGPSPSPFEFGIFGHRNCNHFDVRGEECLSSEGWDLLATKITSGVDSSWNFVSLNFTPVTNIRAFAISGSCSEAPALSDSTHYHYLDDIVISEYVPGDSINLSPIQESGNCIDDKILTIDQPDATEYQWYFNSIPIAGANNPIYTIEAPYTNGEYAVYVNTASGCGVTEPIEVSLEADVVDFIGEVRDNPCFGAEEGQIEIQIPSQNAPYNVIIDNGVTIQTIMDVSDGLFLGENLSSGFYDITLVDKKQCYGSEQFEISSPEALDVSVSVAHPFFDGDFGSATLSPSGGIPPYMISWSDGDMNYDRDSLLAGKYFVTVTDQNSCDSIVQVEIISDFDFNTAYIPNIFSPNDDGINDWFTPFSNFSKKNEISSMKIFDRWGNLVFQKDNWFANHETDGWNGKQKDNDVLLGVYVYSLSILIPDGKVKNIVGNVTLVN